MKLIVNGMEREYAAQICVADLLRELDISSKRIAVELNGKVIRGAEFEKTSLNDSDRLEIVQFVGGG
jgi:sulfur carrier protein